MLNLYDIMASLASNITDYNLIEAGLKVKQVLIKHLLTEDMKYRDYLVETGKLSASRVAAGS